MSEKPRRAPWAVRHARPPGEPCANCGAILAGPYCHACGQNSDSRHRSAWKLTGEALAGAVDYDNRIWRTLPRLFFSSGGLTRDYLAGKRASQTSPLKMFLVVVVLVFLAGGQAVETKRSDVNATVSLPALAAPAAKPAAAPASKWRSARVTRRSEAVVARMGKWAPRVAFLLMPIATLLLGLLFVTRRGLVLFDHAVFAMHSLTFQGLLLTFNLAVGHVWEAAGWLLLAAPLHLFFHMRLAYGLSTLGTLWRLAVFLIGLLIGIFLLIVGLFIVSIYDVVLFR